MKWRIANFPHNVVKSAYRKYEDGNLPVSYHSKLSKRPNIYTLNLNLNSTNIMFITNYIMENDNSLSSANEKTKNKPQI